MYRHCLDDTRRRCSIDGLVTITGTDLDDIGGVREKDKRGWHGFEEPHTEGVVVVNDLLPCLLVDPALSICC